jgi:hypothetical protein
MPKMSVNLLKRLAKRDTQKLIKAGKRLASKTTQGQKASSFVKASVRKTVTPKAPSRADLAGLKKSTQAVKRFKTDVSKLKGLEKSARNKVSRVAPKAATAAKAATIGTGAGLAAIAGAAVLGAAAVGRAKFKTLKAQKSARESKRIGLGLQNRLRRAKMKKKK